MRKRNRFSASKLRSGGDHDDHLKMQALKVNAMGLVRAMGGVEACDTKIGTFAREYGSKAEEDNTLSDATKTRLHDATETLYMLKRIIHKLVTDPEMQMIDVAGLLASDEFRRETKKPLQPDDFNATLAEMLKPLAQEAAQRSAERTGENLASTDVVLDTTSTTLRTEAAKMRRAQSAGDGLSGETEKSAHLNRISQKELALLKTFYAQAFKIFYADKNIAIVG